MHVGQPTNSPVAVLHRSALSSLLYTPAIVRLGVHSVRDVRKSDRDSCLSPFRSMFFFLQSVIETRLLSSWTSRELLCHWSITHSTRWRFISRSLHVVHASLVACRGVGTETTKIFVLRQSTGRYTLLLQGRNLTWIARCRETKKQGSGCNRPTVYS